MTARKFLLEDLLTSLVREWGYVEVTLALSKIQRKDASGEQAPTKKKGKPTALELLEAASLPIANETILREIAIRFDSKTFLPSVADVREFIMMLGKQPKFIKDRSDAFREIIYAVQQLPTAHLELLAQQARHAGPSQLGPLSDAISASSISRRETIDPIDTHDLIEKNKT